MLGEEPVQSQTIKHYAVFYSIINSLQHSYCLHLPFKLESVNEQVKTISKNIKKVNKSNFNPTNKTQQNLNYYSLYLAGILVSLLERRNGTVLSGTMFILSSGSGFEVISIGIRSLRFLLVSVPVSRTML